jgi:UDP-glucose 4-epimerase
MAYSKFCNALLSGETLRVTGDGSQRRSNTFIDDAARAALIAAEVQLDGEIFNIAGSKSIALTDAIDILAGEMGVSPLVEFVPDARGDQKETAGDYSKAQRLLGWTPKVSIEEGLRLQARAARESFRGVVR